MFDVLMMVDFGVNFIVDGYFVFVVFVGLFDDVWEVLINVLVVVMIIGGVGVMINKVFGGV